MRGINSFQLLKPDKGGTRARKTIALSLASGLTTLMSVIMQMVSTRVLSITDYAVYSQTFLISSTISPFLLMGIPSGIYYVFVRNEDRIRAVVKEAASILLLNGVLFLLFIYMGRTLITKIFGNDELSDTMGCLGIYTIFTLALSLITPILVYLDRINFNAIYNAVKSLFCVSITTIVLCITKTAMGGVVANTVTNGLVAAFGVFAVLIILPKDDAHMRKDSIITLLKISVPLGISTMLGTLDTYLDKWIISILMSPEEYAVFSVGAREIPLINAITGAVTTVILVDMNLAVKEKRIKDAIDLFKDSARKTALFLMPTMMLFMAVAKPFIGFLYTDNYLSAVIVFRIYLFYLPVRTVFYGPLMIAMGKSKQILFRSLVEIVFNMFLSIVLVNLFSSIGASIATIISLYFVSVPINMMVISKEAKIKWYAILPFKHYLKCIILAVPGTVISFVIVNILNNAGANYLIQLVLGASVFCLITGFIYIKGFSLPVREYIRKLLLNRKLGE